MIDEIYSVSFSKQINLSFTIILWLHTKLFGNNNFHNRKSKNFKSITSSDESRVANPMPRMKNNFPYLLIMSFFSNNNNKSVYP